MMAQRIIHFVERYIRQRASGRAGYILCSAIFCSSLVQSSFAQARPSEDQVKAAYLLNFGKFVRRSTVDPQSASFDICLLGHDEIAQILERTTRDERLDGRAVRIKQYDNAAEARACAIVFMGASEAGRLEKDLSALQGSDALTVSDLPQFLKRGGMVEFLLQNSRIRFSVNLDSVNRTNLQLSSELLKVASSIVGSPRREVAP